MAEELVGTFSATYSVREEHGIGEPCTLFITNARLIVMEAEGLDERAYLALVILFAVGFVGLVIRNVVLLVVGIAAAMIVSLALIRANSVIRTRRIKKAKTLPPDQVLKLGRSNFEIPYKQVARVELERLEELKRGTILIPSLPEYTWTVRFVPTDENEDVRVFIISSDTLGPFLESIKKFVPEIKEIETE